MFKEIWVCFKISIVVDLSSEKENERKGIESERDGEEKGELCEKTHAHTRTLSLLLTLTLTHTHTHTYIIQACTHIRTHNYTHIHSHIELLLTSPKHEI